MSFFFGSGGKVQGTLPVQFSRWWTCWLLMPRVERLASLVEQVWARP